MGPSEERRNGTAPDGERDLARRPSVPAPDPPNPLGDTLGREPVVVEEPGVRGGLAPGVLDADPDHGARLVRRPGSPPPGPPGRRSPSAPRWSRRAAPWPPRRRSPPASTGLIVGTWSTPAEMPSAPSSSAAASVRAVCWPVETRSDLRALAEQDHAARLEDVVRPEDVRPGLAAQAQVDGSRRRGGPAGHRGHLGRVGRRRTVMPGMARIDREVRDVHVGLAAEPGHEPVYAAPILTLAWVCATAIRTWSSARFVKKIPNELSHGHEALEREAGRRRRPCPARRSPSRGTGPGRPLANFVGLGGGREVGVEHEQVGVRRRRCSISVSAQTSRCGLLTASPPSRAGQARRGPRVPRLAVGARACHSERPSVNESPFPF